MLKNSAPIPVLLVCTFAAAWACGSNDLPSTFEGPDAGLRDARADVPLLPAPLPPTPIDDDNTKDYDELPEAPLVEAGLPADIVAQFGAGTASASAPCMLEPSEGTRYPRNWSSPEITLTAEGNVYEVELRVENQKFPLRAYVSKLPYRMPDPLWAQLRKHSWERKMTMRVRSATLDQAGKASAFSAPSEVDVGILGANAPGSVVYWSIQTDPVTQQLVGKLEGLRIGEENFVKVLEPVQVKERSTRCIGCHTATPDGTHALMVGFSVNDQDSLRLTSAKLEAPGTGDGLSFISAAARAKIQERSAGVIASSPAFWSANNHVVVTEWNGYFFESLNLDTGASTTIAREGDPRKVAFPAWTKSGTTLVYMSTDNLLGAYAGAGPGDIYTVPFNNGLGGKATPLAGASDPNRVEYYPALSPDDELVAFNKASDNGDPYNNKSAEVHVVPISGGTPTRLRANDPPSCSGFKSPGVTNSWPKFAPSVGKTALGKVYYVVMSSQRGHILAPTKPQLFVAPVTVSSAGVVTTYAAIRIPNQNRESGNHTPAWDNFVIPPAPPK